MKGKANFWGVYALRMSLVFFCRSENVMKTVEENG
jgi:hypothetical protein